MMDRREFCKYLSLIAAGTSAVAGSAAAFEHYFLANMPVTTGRLIAIDEIVLSGIAWTATPVNFLLDWKRDRMNLSFNAFGGIMFYSPPPDHKILAVPDEVAWTVQHWQRDEDGCRDAPNDAWVCDRMTGHLSYIDNSAKRHIVPIDKVRGTLTAG